MATFRTAAPIHAVQSPYNLFERGIEKDVLPYARRAGITVLGYGALCRGLLSGKISANTRFEGDDLRKADPKFQQPRLNQYLAAVHDLQRLAQVRFGKSVLALAVRWILDQGGTVALWGARKPEHLASVDEVLGWSLDEAVHGVHRSHPERPDPRPGRPGVHGAANANGRRNEPAGATGSGDRLKGKHGCLLW